MRIIGVEFADKNACSYDRLAAVWKYSAQKAHPEAKVDLIHLPSPKRHTSHQERNHIKLKVWRNEVLNSEEDIVLMDVDMLVLKDISHIFDKSFDVCYTKRVGTKMPLNGGVLFVKSTDLAKHFFKKWYKQDETVLRSRGNFGTFVHRYGGQNQASFGYMLEKGKHPAKIIHVPCPIYNCCNESWKDVDDTTRVIHCKGPLKRYLSGANPNKNLRPEQERIVKLWKIFEEEMKNGRGKGSN